MNKVRVKIGGMSCQHCVGSVKTALEGLSLKELSVAVGEASFVTTAAASREGLTTLLDELGFDLLDFEVTEPGGD